MMKKLTAIVPIHRIDRTKEILQTYCNQDAVAKDVEVIFLMTNPRTMDEAISIFDGVVNVSKHDYKCIRLPGKSNCESRNIAAKQALGERLLFIDGDQLIHSSLFRKHIECVKEGQVGVGIFNIDINVDNDVISIRVPSFKHDQVSLSSFRVGRVPLVKFVEDLYYTQALGYARMHNRNNLTDYINFVTRNVSIWKTDFDKIGGFDEELGYSENSISRGWEDSVTSDTPVMIKFDNDEIDILPISDLYSMVEVGFYPKIYSQFGWSNLCGISKHLVSKPIYRVRTSSGVIDVTGDHSLMKDCKKILVSNIKQGDCIDCETIPPSPLGEYSDVSLAWILGFFSAEGTYGVYHGKTIRNRNGKSYVENYTCNNWKVAGKDKSLLLKAKLCCEKVFPQFEFRLWKEKSRDMWWVHVTKNTKALIDLFDSIGVYTKSREKRVPRCILNGSLEMKRAFIDGNFCGDGHLEVSRGRRGFTTNSKTLAAGIQCLLKDLQINTHIMTRIDKPTIMYLREYGKNRLGSNQFSTKVGEPLFPGKVLDIFVTSEEPQEVYDIETVSHTFLTALGGIVAHNTEMGIRAFEAKLEFVFVPSWAVHINHPEMMKDRGVENMYTMVKKHPWFVEKRPDWFELHSYDINSVIRRLSQEKGLK